MFDDPTSPCPKPDRRFGHRAVAAAIALGLLAPVGVLTVASPALGARSRPSVAPAPGGTGGRGVESWVTDLNTA